MFFDISCTHTAAPASAVGGDEWSERISKNTPRRMSVNTSSWLAYLLIEFDIYKRFRKQRWDTNRHDAAKKISNNYGESLDRACSVWYTVYS